MPQPEDLCNKHNNGDMTPSHDGVAKVEEIHPSLSQHMSSNWKYEIIGSSVNRLVNQMWNQSLKGNKYIYGYVQDCSISSVLMKDTVFF